MVDNDFEEPAPAPYQSRPKTPAVILTHEEEMAMQLLKRQRDEHYAETGEPLTPFVGCIQSVDRFGDTCFIVCFISPSNPDGKGIRYQFLRLVRHTADEFLDYFCVAGELIDINARVNIASL